MQTDISYRLVLASASPARRNLLKAAGIDVDVLVSGVDESAVEADDAYTLSLALARMKARTVAAQMRAEPGVLILDGHLDGHSTHARLRRMPLIRDVPPPYKK